LGLPVTNSMVCTWIVAALILVIVRATTPRKIQEIPSGMQNVLEALVEGWEGLIGDILDKRGIKYDNLGQGGSVGLLVTKTLVVLGDTLMTSKTHARGAMLRAYDKATGKELGAVWMPAPQSGSPMTYQAGGKQYIIVAVSGGNYSGEYIAYALPEAE